MDLLNTPVPIDHTGSFYHNLDGIMGASKARRINLVSETRK